MPWTFDQWMHLLAVLAWPAVALIAGVAWVHGCRLLLESVDVIASVIVQCVNDNTQGAVSKICGAWMQTTSRAAGPVPVDWKAERVAVTSERALLAVLAARGGFPAKQAEAPGRALVREVREMYAELNQPTPRPEPTPGTTDAGAGAGSVDDFDIEIDGVADDLFAEFMATDEDAAQVTANEEGELE